MPVAVFRYGELFQARLHFEITSGDMKFRSLQVEVQLRAIERQDKILKLEVTQFAADLSPLLVGCEE